MHNIQYYYTIIYIFNVIFDSYTRYYFDLLTFISYFCFR